MPEQPPRFLGEQQAPLTLVEMRQEHLEPRRDIDRS